MSATALIQGASRGIGLAMTRNLLEREFRVFATCRAPERARELRELEGKWPDLLEIVRLELTDERSIWNAAQRVGSVVSQLNLLVNVSGLLHDGDLGPEKKLKQVQPDALRRVFEVNAFGPLLVAKHFKHLLQHRERAVLANVSARVGSIGDNRLGGWYAYRASKAAQNMFTKTLAIELGRGGRKVTVIALHPGTVETELSAPFRGGVKPEKLFSPERAAKQLLEICEKVTDDDTGSFFAWDGSPIEW